MVRVQKLTLFLPRDAMRYSSSSSIAVEISVHGAVKATVTNAPLSQLNKMSLQQFLELADCRTVIAQSLLSSGVRLSFTFVHCIQMAEDIVKHLSPPGSPMILVF